ncbi:hypothetical protein IGK61_000999 [Enterococcus sp. AZ063]
MNCKTCKDERIVWTKDKYNRVVAVNCPDCNKNGIAVKNETEEWKHERNRSILGKRSLAREK